jgi:hypothetical protein
VEGRGVRCVLGTRGEMCVVDVMDGQKEGREEGKTR